MVLAKDVAEWIEYKNPSKVLNGVDDDEKLIAVCDVTNSYTTSKSRNTQEMWFLTEDGLYINRLKRIYDLNTSDVFKEW